MLIMTDDKKYHIKEIPNCIFFSLLQLSVKILNSIHFDTINDTDDNKISYCSIIESFFSKSQQLLNQIKKFIKHFEKIDSILINMFQKIGEYPKYIKSETNLIISILSFAIELSSIFKVKFIQIDNFIEKWFSNESNSTPTLQFSDETDISDSDDKIDLLKSTFSSLTKADKMKTISSLLDFRSKNEICSLFAHVESTLHLFGLIFRENSFLWQKIASSIEVWALYITVISDLLSPQPDLFNFSQKSFFDDADEEELMKRDEEGERELLFAFLVPKQHFSLSIFEGETIDLLKLKIFSLETYLRLLKNFNDCKNKDCIENEKICSAIRAPLVTLFDDCSSKSAECFYENLLLSSNLLQNVFMFDNDRIDGGHQLLLSLKNCLQTFLISTPQREEIQNEILNILVDLSNNEKFIAFSTNCSVACQLFLFLLDNCQNSVILPSLLKINENFLQNIFDFASKFPDLVNYESVCECVETMSESRQVKVIHHLSNVLKNVIFIITNNNYYNINNFSQMNDGKSAKYSWSQCQSFLIKVFKSNIPKIASNLISKGENVSLLLDFFSLSSFISSTSSQFTYLAPTIVKVTSSMLGQSNDTFLMMSNSNNSFASFVDWKVVAEQLKDVEIKSDTYIKILQILSAYSTITYPLDTEQKGEENTSESSLSSIFLFGINNSSAVPLISIILQTQFARDFIDTLHKMVTANVIQAMKLFKSNGLSILLDSISSLYDNRHFKTEEVTSLVDAILRTAVCVLTFICSKEMCEKFQKVFYDLKTDQMKNEANFIDAFKASFVPNPLFTSSFFHFNSTNSLFFLPPVPLSFLENGVSFVTELLIPSFGEISPSFFSFYNEQSDLVEDELFEIPIFYVASENGKDGGYNYLVISLFRNKISFSSNVYETTVYVSVELPQNEWFTLSVSVKKWMQFKVQVIESQKAKPGESVKKGQQAVKTREVEANLVSPWSIPIHRIEMFNISFFSPPDVIKHFKSQRRIEGLIRRVMLFSGSFVFGQPDADGQSIACRSQQLFGHFTPQYCSLQESRLENMVSGRPESIFMINTEPIPLSNEAFVCTFGDFFLKFNGLIEFVLYFSKSGLNEDELVMLFETLCFLFERFPLLQKEMYAISGYHLIAHFLNTRQKIEITNRFFDEVCALESKTTNEPLLDQLRNNLIVNFPQYLDCEDNELLFRILKKWQEYDSSFFRSHVSFSKFCHIMFHQFSERKDAVDMSIKKTLMSILNVNAMFLEKQDLYLLTQLTGKLAADDMETSILLIKEIYGITKDHPTKLDTVQRGLIEISDKPPEILCTIVKLFDTDDEYTKRLLYTEMSEKRTPQQRAEFVLCFFNSIFNTHKHLSFEELAQLDEFHLVSVNLLLFILSFGFECDESVVSSIVTLIGNISLKKPESAKFVSNSIGMNSITLFVFISFAVFKSHHILNFVMSLIFCNVSLLADSLRIISVLSAYCRTDLSEYQSLILNTFILKMIESAFDRKSSQFDDMNQVVDIIVSFICFGPNRSVFDTTAAASGGKNASQRDEQARFSLVDFFKAFLEYPITIEQNEYGAFLGGGGYWTDMKTVELLLTLIGSDGLDEDSTRKLLILLSFLINRYNQIAPQKVAEILDRVNAMCDSFFYTRDGSHIIVSDRKTKPIPYCDMLIPVFVSLHQNGYKEIVEKKGEGGDSQHLEIISAFIEAFEVNNDVFDKYNAIMQEFVSGLHEISNVSERLLTGLTNESLIKEEKVTIEEAFADVRQKEITLSIHREKIYRKHRPVYLKASHYRRYNIFDEYFRPFMLTNKERLKFVQIDSPVFNDNTLGSGEGSIKGEAVLWSSPCQRIKVDQTFDGYFSVTNNGYRFITPKGKSYRLMKTSIRYVFWNYCNNEPLSFTIFLLNGKCFLFRFFRPETRESITEKLSLIDLENCHFFQTSKGYEEVGKLKLTQRWRDRSISNFDYLMWLNLLSGRTFLDPDYYPIFPLLFASGSDKTEMRDLEKSVLFMCEKNMPKWKQVRLTYDPYDNFMLSSSFSTQQVVCTFLGGIEQFNERESEDAARVHSQHYFYSAFDDVRARDGHTDYMSNNEKRALMHAASSSVPLHTHHAQIKGSKSCSDKEASASSVIAVNRDMTKLHAFSSLIDGLKASEVHTELIPEFFFLPEVFKAWTSSKDDGCESSFPAWAPTASKFILAHTVAIESEEVSMNLHKWIDIIWGGRQNDYMYNPALEFASNDENVQRHMKRLEIGDDGFGIEGHLPPVFFAGPHPARHTLPSFQSYTTSVKLQLKKKEKKDSLRIDFQPLVNAFFINNSKNNEGPDSGLSIEIAARPRSSSSFIEEIDIEAAAVHERSVLQMMKRDAVDPISIGVVNMKKRNVYVLFSNEKVVQLPGSEKINLTKQIEASRQNALSITPAGHSQNAALNSPVVPNYGDRQSFCFFGTALYFVPLGSRSLFCFDFQYNKLFTTAPAATTAHLYGVTCIDASDGFVVSGSKDTSVIAWSKEPSGVSPFKLLTSHRKPIKLLRIVRKMRVLLSIDEGRTLCVSMFPYLRLIKETQLDFLPEFVDATRCCIIAFAGQKVVSFTSNGEKIAERSFKVFSVVCEVAVDVVSRSDVVLIATTNKDVLLLNCVSLEIVGVLIKLDSVARMLEFDEDSGTVAIVTESNEVVFTQIPD